MEKEYRSASIGILIMGIFLVGIWILLGVLAYQYIKLSDEMDYIIQISIIIIFFIPALCLFLLMINEYGKKVIVKSDSVSYYHWGRHIRTFLNEEITVYGVAQFYAKDSYIFYCKASEEDILKYWNTHQKMAKRIFRKQYSLLKESDDNLWQIMVGTYIRKKLSSRADNIIVTDCTYNIDFYKIIKIMNKKLILTGIVLLNNPGAWEDEVKKSGI